MPVLDVPSHETLARTSEPYRLAILQVDGDEAALAVWRREFAKGLEQARAEEERMTTRSTGGGSGRSASRVPRPSGRGWRPSSWPAWTWARPTTPRRRRLAFNTDLPAPAAVEVLRELPAPVEAVAQVATTDFARHLAQVHASMGDAAARDFDDEEAALDYLRRVRDEDR